MTSVYGRLRLTAAEQFWYVLQCIAFGAGYFAKVPGEEGPHRISTTSWTWQWWLEVRTRPAVSIRRSVPVNSAE